MVSPHTIMYKLRTANLQLCEGGWLCRSISAYVHTDGGRRSTSSIFLSCSALHVRDWFSWPSSLERIKCDLVGGDVAMGVGFQVPRVCLSLCLFSLSLSLSLSLFVFLCLLPGDYNEALYFSSTMPGCMLFFPTMMIMDWPSATVGKSSSKCPLL